MSHRDLTEAPLQFQTSEEYQIAQFLVQFAREAFLLFDIFVFSERAQTLLKVRFVEELVWAQFSGGAVPIRDNLQI